MQDPIIAAAYSDLERAVAALGLSSHLELPSSIDNVELGAFLQIARRTSLTGLFAEAVKTGTIELTGEQRSRVTQTHIEVMAHSLRLERLLAAVGNDLRKAGISFRVLKGAALEKTVYPDPSLRHGSDLDLLVHTADVDDSVSILVAAGGRRVLPEVRPGFDASFEKDIPISFSPAQVDLHRTLIAGPYGFALPLEDMMTSTDAVHLPAPPGEKPVLALDPVDQYLHAALTAGVADYPPRLITLRDMIEIQSYYDLDPDTILERARHWNIATPLALATGLINSVLRPDKHPPLTQWAATTMPSSRERRILDTYLSSNTGYRRAAATLKVLPWRDRPRYARAIMMPSTSYRNARGWNRRKHLRTAAQKLRRTRPRR